MADLVAAGHEAELEQRVRAWLSDTLAEPLPVINVLKNWLKTHFDDVASDRAARTALADWLHDGTRLCRSAGRPAHAHAHAPAHAHGKNQTDERAGAGRGAARQGVGAAVRADGADRRVCARRARARQQRRV